MKIKKWYSRLTHQFQFIVISIIIAFLILIVTFLFSITGENVDIFKPFTTILVWSLFAFLFSTLGKELDNNSNLTLKSLPFHFIKKLIKKLKERRSDANLTWEEYYAKYPDMETNSKKVITVKESTEDKIDFESVQMILFGIFAWWLTFCLCREYLSPIVGIDGAKVIGFLAPLIVFILAILIPVALLVAVPLGALICLIWLIKKIWFFV